MNKQERILSSLQEPKLKAEKFLQHWYVPLAFELVSKALEHGDRKEMSLLVVGCGKGDDAFLYSDYLGLNSNVVGIDPNEKSIRIANEIKAGDPKEPRFLVGNILDKNIGKKISQRSQLSSFHAIVFNGVFEYFLKTSQIQQALSNTERLLRPDGKIVISDFAWWKPKGWGENWWEKRYRRDEQALKLVGAGRDLFGIIVVRTKGLHSEDVLSLSAQETAQALKEGDFARVVRHWRFSRIKRILEKNGFEILDEKRALGCWEAFNRPEELKEKDKLFNYQILAKKC